MADLDLILARKLQEEFDRESASLLTPAIGSNGAGNVSSSQGLSVVDPSWETTDPNPDVRALFLQFNDQYFWGKLFGVEVKWSPRMTLCAGVCSYEGRGGLCSIRLSVPLLKLRPRKDLVETLLHEMIHAFLFVTENDRDRDGHGPNFQKHMHRINKASGANITIYHDFHDEVDSYRQHWWRCDGPCKSRPPYYGWVKRAMNRAPSPRDFWWGDHMKSCGGTYTKVKEPEGYGVKKKGAKEDKKDDKTEQTSPNMDIRSFFGKGNVLGSSSQDSKPYTSSGISKKTTSTITSTDSGARKTVGSTQLNNNEDPALPFDVEQWTGGIWASENKSASGATSNSSDNKLVDSNSHAKEATAGQSQKKNWTVVETKNDKDLKTNTGIKVQLQGDSQQPKTGHVLGSSSGSNLSFLARLRKEWAGSCNGNAGKPTSSTTQQNASSAGKSGQHQASQAGSKRESASDTITATATKPSNMDETSNMSQSDGSWHDSFHVSSCEEDSWPTPDKYTKKSKTTSVCESKRKRTALDSVSSDEEELVLPTALKRAKQQGTSLASKDSHISESSNVFLRIKAQNQSPSKDKTVLPGNPPAQDTAAVKTQQYGASHSSPQSKPMHTDAFSRVDVNTQNSSSVGCPSCQKQVPADRINDHLDVCLS